ncbi:hypothetical protein ESA94_07155 [Lacibacter luteus]|uniref:DUF4251 domain-containing protein n=1 Tax=Lacibacter luteus TaxID=2508719 RepID=A0A4Q1CNQ1_9BACT|nr:hypothetical protein [Lacibacter luteus]RXK62767.1 hypothetical protein ESA94_07155 [Lacibacter luteus]
MNKLFTVLSIVFFLAAQIVSAQCDPKVLKLQSNKARGLKTNMQAEELAMETVIAIDSVKIVLTGSFNGETETLEGNIVEVVSCEWGEYLKNGKTEYRIVVGKDGASMKSIMILESENGNTTLTFFEEDKTDTKLQFVISEYSITEITKPVNTPVQPEKKSKKQKRKS